MSDGQQRGRERDRVLGGLLDLVVADLPLADTLTEALSLVLSLPGLAESGRGCIAHADATTGVLALPAQRGLPAALLEGEGHGRLCEFLRGQAATGGHLRLLEPAEPALRDLPGELAGQGRYSVPIVVGENLLGLLCLFVAPGYRRSADDEAFLLTVSKTLAAMMRSRAAEESSEALARLRREMLDTPVVWIDALDGDGNVSFWNRGAERLSGYSRDEVLGHADVWRWLFPGPDYRREVFSQARRPTRTDEGYQHFEAVVHSKAGEQVVI